MRPITRALVLLLVPFLAPVHSTATAGLGDLKKKAEQKAKEAADRTTGKPETPAPTPGGAAEPNPTGGSDGSVSAVSTKFDFVPGAKVLLMDDFTRDELGEFPTRWKLIRGNFDIVEFEGERWLRLNGTDGLVTMKNQTLPEKWTLEFDCYQPTMTGPVVTVSGMPRGSDSNLWYATIGQSGKEVTFTDPNGVTSTSAVPGGLDGRQHISIMAAGTGVKVYVGCERMMNIPEMEFSAGVTLGAIGIRLWRHGSDPLITNVRFAEGGKEKVDMMATPFVTHGIVFDSGSDRLKPQSAAVLRQVAGYLKENAAVKVMITGHTDDVGETAANQTLSEKRSAAVAASLARDFGVDAARLATEGRGESAPMAKNDSPEGRATNRRVEFRKN